MTTKKSRTAKTIEPSDLCCERFRDAYAAGEILYAYKETSRIDETAWIIDGLWHMYYCPFCGAFIKGQGFGDYDERYPPDRERKVQA